MRGAAFALLIAIVTVNSCMAQTAIQRAALTSEHRDFSAILQPESDTGSDQGQNATNDQHNQGVAKKVFARIGCDQFTISCPNATKRRFNPLWLLPIAATAAFIPADKDISKDVPKGSISASQTASDVGLYGSIGSLGLLGIMGAIERRHAEHRKSRARDSHVRNRGICEQYVRVRADKVRRGTATPTDWLAAGIVLESSRMEHVVSLRTQHNEFCHRHHHCA
jgi:hypothetical protein